MNHFSYPVTIVQINIFKEPQNIFPNQNPRPQTIEPAPPVFLTIECPPWGSYFSKAAHIASVRLIFVPSLAHKFKTIHLYIQTSSITLKLLLTNLVNQLKGTAKFVSKALKDLVFVLTVFI